MKNTLYSVRIILFFSILLLSISQQVISQATYSKSPNMPQHYANRVAIFEKQPIVTGKILFLGNSITEGGR